MKRMKTNGRRNIWPRERLKGGFSSFFLLPQTKIDNIYLESYSFHTHKFGTREHSVNRIKFNISILLAVTPRFVQRTLYSRIHGRNRRAALRFWFGSLNQRESSNISMKYPGICYDLIFRGVQKEDGNWGNIFTMMNGNIFLSFLPDHQFFLALVGEKIWLLRRNTYQCRKTYIHVHRRTFRSRSSRPIEMDHTFQ